MTERRNAKEKFNDAIQAHDSMTKTLVVKNKQITILEDTLNTIGNDIGDEDVVKSIATAFAKCYKIGEEPNITGWRGRIKNISK